jgi:methanogenic corrinoid protein MtbC1
MSRLESAPESATRPSRAAAPAGSATAGPAQGADPRAGVDATEALVRAAERLDAVAASAVIDDRFALGTFEHVVDAWLMPALERLGEAWADGRVSVAGEHLVSYAVQRRLASAYEAAAGRGTGPSVVLGLPAGARHELGLLAFAVAARRAGLATTYVGADLPVGDWVGAVAARRAAGVVLSVPCRADLTPAHQIVSGLRAADPHLVVGVGGRFQDEVGNGSVPLGHSIEDGVAELVRQLPVAP